jgi:hypothetical protein
VHITNHNTIKFLNQQKSFEFRAPLFTKKNYNISVMNLAPLQIILLLLHLVAFKLASSGSNGPNRDGASALNGNNDPNNGDGTSSSSGTHRGGGQDCRLKGEMVKKVFTDYRTFPTTKFNLLLSEKPIGEGTFGKVSERDISP